MTVNIEKIAALIRIAHSANPPDCCEPGECGNLTFPAMDGWQVVFFYDVGDLDHIDHFITPSGETIGLWGDDIPAELDDREEDQCFGTLHCWRDHEDTDRLLAHLAQKAAA